MWIVHGGKARPLEREELLETVSAYRSCLLDVGTGDGRFVYRYAREHPETFSIGLDPVREALRKISAKAAKKPARGGVPNVLFVAGNVEDLPGPAAGLADLVTVNYPWGALLRALVAPEPQILERLVAAMKPVARISVLINLSVFEDREYVERLNLRPVSLERVDEELVPGFSRHGIELEQVRILDGDRDVPHRTSWGQHLALGSKRKTLLLTGRRK